jgi:hypothetical protein
MGLLDDAIREHLELKRRSGADVGEVERLEREALGPARREAEAPGDAHERGAPAEEQDAFVPTPEDEEIQSLAEDEEPLYDDDLLGEPAAEDEPGEEPPAPAARSTVDQPTEQFDVTEPDEDEGDRSGRADRPQDELEETPEFLQETPEHDRLWFEQKPPRDFDF